MWHKTNTFSSSILIWCLCFSLCFTFQLSLIFPDMFKCSVSLHWPHFLSASFCFSAHSRTSILFPRLQWAQPPTAVQETPVPRVPRRRPPATRCPCSLRRSVTVRTRTAKAPEDVDSSSFGISNVNVACRPVWLWTLLCVVWRSRAIYINLPQQPFLFLFVTVESCHFFRARDFNCIHPPHHYQLILSDCTIET